MSQSHPKVGLDSRCVTGQLKNTIPPQDLRPRDSLPWDQRNANIFMNPRGINFDDTTRVVLRLLHCKRVWKFMQVCCSPLYFPPFGLALSKSPWKCVCFACPYQATPFREGLSHLLLCQLLRDCCQVVQQPLNSSITFDP